MVDIDLWAQDMAHYLQEHMDTEREALRAYAHLAEEVRNEQIRFLINMILDDEVRHHRIFQEMVNWIRAEHAQLEDIASTMGDSTPPSEKERRHLLEMTDQLLELEEEDEKELRELERKVVEVVDTEWWVALVDAMRHDTRKHVMLLQAIKRLAGG